MEIANVRIDERLIHGQVAAYWTNTLNATRIMVIDDICASDQIQKMALKMAAPKTVKLSVLTIDKAIERLSDPTKYVGERLFIIMGSTETLRKIIEKGYLFTEVNVGNISGKFDTKQVIRSVAVNKRDVENLNFAFSKGIKIAQQMIPSEEKKDMMKLLEKVTFD